MARVIHNSKEDLDMNDYVASHGSSWKGIHHSSVFLSHSVSIFLTRFLTHHLREVIVISQFPFLRSRNVKKTEEKVYANIRRDPISK